MKVVAVVPMKLNNRRLPQKNTKSFTNGKPLCCYILSTLLKVKMIDEVYVYCSNPDIKEFLPDGVKYLRRSESLDQDTTKMNEVLKCFANDVTSDIYVMTHTTAPFVTASSIEKGLEAVVSGEYDSAFCAVKIQDFLWQDGEPLNFDAANVPRSQDLAPIYRETSGVYVFTREVFERCHRRIGWKPYIKEVSFKEAVDINNPEDFRLAAAMVNIDL